jgi:hypothetical protein
MFPLRIDLIIGKCLISAMIRHHPAPLFFIHSPDSRLLIHVHTLLSFGRISLFIMVNCFLS